jgi:hypothetical protein
LEQCDVSERCIILTVSAFLKNKWNSFSSLSIVYEKNSHWEVGHRQSYVCFMYMCTNYYCLWVTYVYKSDKFYIISKLQHKF